MLQDIYPHILDLSFHQLNPQADDRVLAFDNDQALLYSDQNGLNISSYRLFHSRYPEKTDHLSFLFSISGVNFFLGHERLPLSDGFGYHSVQVFRQFDPAWLGFAGATASHLAVWLGKNKYCGRCGSLTAPSPKERALVCPACGNIVYPIIAPVVIVGIIDGDRILMTRYSQGLYRKLALVAGFVEIGETMEDAVRREVREEVGLEIKNIRYYKSQPWPFSQSMLAGFFADLDGSDQITLDLNELSEAFWMPRGEIPEDGSSISLTYEMIEAFRRSDYPKYQTIRS